MLFCAGIAGTFGGDAAAGSHYRAAIIPQFGEPMYPRLGVRAWGHHHD
jgi:hypothetical protein